MMRTTPYAALETASYNLVPPLTLFSPHPPWGY
jgi:hypothetical protein